MLMYGPFGNPQEEGSMAVFTSREAAEEFAAGDPFVVHGVVRNWSCASGTRLSCPTDPGAVSFDLL
jgi:uncharacterized protein YciI